MSLMRANRLQNARRAAGLDRDSPAGTSSRQGQRVVRKAVVMSSHAPVVPTAAGAGRKPVTLRTLAQMKKEGKLRYYGLCNVTAAEVEAADTAAKSAGVPMPTLAMIVNSRTSGSPRNINGPVV